MRVDDGWRWTRPGCWTIRTSPRKAEPPSSCVTHNGWSPVTTVLHIFSLTMKHLFYFSIFTASTRIMSLQIKRKNITKTYTISENKQNILIYRSVFLYLYSLFLLIYVLYDTCVYGITTITVLSSP